MNYNSLKITTKKFALITEMNVVPYVDVILVLLVVFMITTPLLTQGVQVDLPQTNATLKLTSQQIPLVLSVDAKGVYYLNVNADPTQPIAPSQLVTRVAAELQLATQTHQPQPRVLVKGDKHVNYELMMEAMSLLQQAGATQIGLIVASKGKG